MSGANVKATPSTSHRTLFDPSASTDRGRRRLYRGRRHTCNAAVCYTSGMGRQKNITQTSRYVSARIPHDVACELDRRAPNGSRSAFIVGAVRAALAADTASQDYQAGYEAGRLAGRREGVDDAIEFMERRQSRERRLVAETMRRRAAGAPLFAAILQEQEANRS